MLSDLYLICLFGNIKAQEITTHSISAKNERFQVSRDSKSKKQRHEPSISKIVDPKPEKN